MKLLVFAHRTEAKAFFEKFNFKPVNINFQNVFQDENLLLLICGEGLQETTQRLSAVCGFFYGKISEILNFGVAGSLSTKIELDKIYSIRTSYAQNLSKTTEFNSFSTTDESAKIDCISSLERILSDEKADTLSHFADLVDRELWAIGSVCKLFKIPFRSYKIVSDLAGNSTQCFDIQEKADFFSTKLFDFYQNLEVKNELLPLRNKFPVGFYFTTTQEKIYSNTLKSLNIKLQKNETEILQNIDLKAIGEKSSKPKERTNLLLEKLNSLLNPFSSTLQTKLNELIKPLKEANCSVKFAKDFENDIFTLNAKIENKKNLEKLKIALANFEYEKVIKILNGEF
ncbi:MAG: hypothetical protein DWQ06_09195 [Calditrichaeota bacterium]|nr:MAG: hypothetical protein DWQ06_09195 [Calditrichota bacterium]